MKFLNGRGDFPIVEGLRRNRQSFIVKYMQVHSVKKESFSFGTALVAMLALLLSCKSILAEEMVKPNIIVIMADDIGAECLESYGSTIYSSPNLTRMAEEGIQFQNAYATPLCTPSRVMIMTGTYPHRNGFGELLDKKSGQRMPADIPTFGHYFQQSGYKTAIAGKWQLGTFDAFPNQPAEHGFDRFCMWTWYYDHKKTRRYYKPHINVDGKMFQGSNKDYGPDYYSNFLLEFIEENKDAPFFIYYPMALVHSPFLIPPGLKEKASENYTTDLDEPTRAFGHMVTYMDDIIGRMMASLKRNGIDGKTLVIFTGDNGTHTRIVSRLPGMNIRGQKGLAVEAGSRVPFIARWPSRIQPAVTEEFFSLVDVLPTIASIAGIDLTAEVDGMDLSHIFLGTEGESREYIVMPFKGLYIRDKRFRLHSDGRLFDIPVTSDQERYSEKETKHPEHEMHRKRLKALVDKYRALPSLYKGPQ
jgi:arylsulfatase A